MILKDKKGEPILCYHSTDREFIRFEDKFIGTGGVGCYHGYGFNFTTNPNTDYGSIVKRAYLDINKSIKSNKKYWKPDKISRIIFNIDEGQTDSLISSITDYAKTSDRDYYKKVRECAQYLYDSNDSDLSIYATLCIATSCNPRKVVKVMKSFGYDSCIEYEKGKPSVVVVFSSEQIIME